MNSGYVATPSGLLSVSNPVGERIPASKARGARKFISRSACVSFAVVTMSNTSEQIADWRGVDAATFRDQIVPKNQPAVLRGVALHWPAVQRGSPSPQAMCSYLMSLRQGGPVPLLTADPAIQGRFFFRDDMRGFNFQRRPAPLAVALRMMGARSLDQLREIKALLAHA